MSQRVLRRTPRRGMTLIEVMLAAGILASIVVLTFGAVSTSFAVRRTSLEKFDRYRTVQQALDRMSRELSMAFVTNIGLQATNDQSEVTYLTTFDGGSDEIDFTSLAHVRTRAGDVASEQAEISYLIENQEGEDGEMHRNLVRREDAPIDEDPTEGGVKYTLLYDVERIHFEYWDSTREIAGEAWVDQWDAINDHEGKLPSRVRMTVEIQHPTLPSRTLEFSTQTQVMLVEPLVIVPQNVLDEITNRAAQIEEALRAEGFEDFGDMTADEVDDFARDEGGEN